MINIDIDELRKCLTKLPGRKIQYQMAPDDRIDLLKEHNYNSQTRKSAVVILIYKKHNTFFSVFTKRAEYKGHHSGQISLPGGKFDASKDKNLKETAIRETFEEIGVKLSDKNFLGQLTSLYIPVSNILVYPYVAFVDGDIKFITDSREVEKIIEFKISDLLISKNKKIEIIEKENKQIKIPYFNIKGQKIWGATAMIINEFVYLINGK